MAGAVRLGGESPGEVVRDGQLVVVEALTSRLCPGGHQSLVRSRGPWTSLSPESRSCRECSWCFSHHIPLLLRAAVHVGAADLSFSPRHSLKGVFLGCRGGSGKLRKPGKSQGKQQDGGT